MVQHFQSFQYKPKNMTTPSDFKEHQAHVVTHAIVVTLLPLVPIPLLDWILEPVVARRMFQPLFKHPTQRRHFVGKGGNFCLGCVTSLVMYPITKLLKIVKFFLQFNTFIKTFFYWFYKSYILYQAQHTLSENCLINHKKMFLLGKDLDHWLRKSNEVPSMTNTSLSSLEGLRTLFTEISNGNFETINSALQNTDVLDTWLKTWAAEHDTPQ